MGFTLVGTNQIDILHSCMVPSLDSIVSSFCSVFLVIPWFTDSLAAHLINNLKVESSTPRHPEPPTARKELQALGNSGLHESQRAIKLKEQPGHCFNKLIGDRRLLYGPH